MSERGQLLAAATRWLVGLALGLSFAALPSTAFGHADVDAGVARYEAAAFPAALSAFQAAEASDDLTRDDLVRLLATRALVYFAMRATDEMDADLLRLASLEPDYPFGRRVPPPVREAFAAAVERAGQPLGLHIESEARGPDVVITAVVEHDAASLVTGTRIHVRRRAEFVAHEGPTVVERGSDGDLDVFAVAVGPGGAPVVRVASAERPHRVQVDRLGLTSASAAASVGDESGEGATGGDGGDDLALGLGLGLAAVVVVAAAIIIPVVLLTSEDGAAVSTLPGAPVAEFP